MFHTSASSSVLHNPSEHFTSLNSPSATVRARPTSSSGGDGIMSSGSGGADKHHGLGHSPGGAGLGGIVMGGGSGGAEGLLTAVGAVALPGRAAVRRTLWALLQGLLLAANLRYLGLLTRLQQDAYFLYYQPFMPMLAMLWLWALAVRIFERRRIRYEACFSPEDQRHLLRSTQLFQVCNVLTSLVLSSGLAFSYLVAYGQHELAALHPPLLYCALLGLLLFPGALLFRDTRLFFGQTLWRVATPLRAVTWADFLLADVLTSLAKALSDTERAVCHLMIGPVMQPHLKACSDGSLIIPLGLAAPYAWRLVQCIRVYLDTGARPQLFNAIKYSTAFPVILLSAVKYHVDSSEWRGFWKPLWLAAALLNSAYSYYWDVERDWEISWFSQMGPGASQQRRLVPAPVLRGQLLYRRPFYLYLMASNLALRLSWAYKLSPHLRDHHVVVFLVALAEAFRRFQWLFVRIEVELRKIQAYRPDLGVLVPTVGYAAHAHSSEAADSGSEDEGAPEGAAGGLAGPKARALPVSVGAGPLPGKPRAVVRQLSGGAELEMLAGGRH